MTKVIVSRFMKVKGSVLFSVFSVVVLVAMLSLACGAPNTNPTPVSAQPGTLQLSVLANGADKSTPRITVNFSRPTTKGQLLYVTCGSNDARIEYLTGGKTSRKFIADCDGLSGTQTISVRWTSANEEANISSASLVHDLSGGGVVTTPKPTEQPIGKVSIDLTVDTNTVTEGGSVKVNVTSDSKHEAAIRGSLKLVPDSTTPSGSTADWDVLFKMVDAGLNHTCAIRGDNAAVECWGSNDNDKSNPPDGAFTALSAGHEHACGVRANGTVECWGDDSSGQSSPPSGRFKLVSAGSLHSCGVRADNNTVECWGHNSNGQANPPSGEFAVVSAGWNHTCGIRVNNTVACWGENDSNESAPPSAGFMFKSISAGDRYACGVRVNGAVECWGDDTRGKSDPPDTELKSVDVERRHSCGVQTDGTVVCWGEDREGQSDPPHGKFAAVSTGDSYTCGLRDNDTVQCWGLGNGTYRRIPMTTSRNFPFEISAMTNSTEVVLASLNDMLVEENETFILSVGELTNAELVTEPTDAPTVITVADDNDFYFVLHPMTNSQVRVDLCSAEVIKSEQLSQAIATKRVTFDLYQPPIFCRGSVDSDTVQKFVASIEGVPDYIQYFVIEGAKRGLGDISEAEGKSGAFTTGITELRYTGHKIVLEASERGDLTSGSCGAAADVISVVNLGCGEPGTVDNILIHEYAHFLDRAVGAYLAGTRGTRLADDSLYKDLLKFEPFTESRFLSVPVLADLEEGPEYGNTNEFEHFAVSYTYYHYPETRAAFKQLSPATHDFIANSIATLQDRLSTDPEYRTVRTVPLQTGATDSSP